MNKVFHFCQQNNTSQTVLCFERGKTQYYRLLDIFEHVLKSSPKRQYRAIEDTTSQFTKPFSLVSRDSLDSLNYPVRRRRYANKDYYFGNQTFVTFLLLSDCSTPIEIRKALLDVVFEDSFRRTWFEALIYKRVRNTQFGNEVWYNIFDVMALSGSTQASFTHSLTPIKRVGFDKFTNSFGCLNLLTTKKFNAKIGVSITKLIAANLGSLENYVPNLRVVTTNIK